MAVMNKVCAEIIDKVNSSQLDYTMNQTPYSLHFSIRKKFSKNSIQVQVSPEDSNYSFPCSDDHKFELFRQELLYTRNEYINLFNFYQDEKNVREKLETDHQKLLEKLDNIEIKESHIKALKQDNKTLQEKSEKSIAEIKYLKNEIGDLNKDKNALSVALKTCKKELKEHHKEFDKKELECEKKIAELSDFKRTKLAEEREAKIQKKKEIKKAKQKAKHCEALNDKPEKRMEDLEDAKRNEDFSTEEEEPKANNETETKVIEEREIMGQTNLVSDESGKDFKNMEGNEASAEDSEDKNVNLMSDQEFCEHLWQKFCNRPRPAKYCSQQESLVNKLGDEKDFDDG